VERDFVASTGVKLKVVDARERFLKVLAGVTDPETKRKIIGTEFIRVFEDAAREISANEPIDFLVQGTLYPDVVESGCGEGTANIKSHHNVGGLPDDLQFKLVEPLRTLFKDEVRQAGLTMGLPEEIIWRQPFPGPGLAIRIVGEVPVALTAPPVFTLPPVTVPVALTLPPVNRLPEVVDPLTLKLLNTPTVCRLELITLLARNVPVNVSAFADSAVIPVN